MDFSKEKIFSGFTLKAILAAVFFFLVLFSWYTLRPIRNEMAVQNEEILPWLLGAGAMVMLLLNPIYSWIASNSNIKNVLSLVTFFLFQILFFLFLLGLFLHYKILFGFQESFTYGRMYTLFL